MSGSVTEADGPRSDAAGVPVRVFARETSWPLLLLGAVVSVSVMPGLVWPSYDSQVMVISRVSGSLPDFVMAVGLTVAFAVLWLTLRRSVSRDEGRSAAGFAVGVVLGVVLVLSGLLYIVGPFVLLGVGLCFGGYKLDDPVLILWAVAVGVAGFWAGTFGLGHWSAAASYLMLSLLTVLAGVIAYLWESRRLRGDVVVRSRLG